MRCGACRACSLGVVGAVRMRRAGGRGGKALRATDRNEMKVVEVVAAGPSESEVPSFAIESLLASPCVPISQNVHLSQQLRSASLALTASTQQPQDLHAPSYPSHSRTRKILIQEALLLLYRSKQQFW